MKMLSTAENLTIVLAVVAVSLLFTVALNKLWPWEKRRVHNDLIGWQISVLGTTYAVILGFMLYTVWTNYGTADLNTDSEANALLNIFRLSAGLPDAQHVQLQNLARAYADTVVNHDWPEMANEQIPDGSRVINANMWKVLMSVKDASPSEITAEDHALSELAALNEHRHMRLLESAATLPIMLWCVLIIGGVVTMASTSMFGSPNFGLHALQVFAFSLLISLALVTIADINRPFQGSVHVSSFAFERAQKDMQANF
jgi:hypothetical protein